MVCMDNPLLLPVRFVLDSKSLLLQLPLMFEYLAQQAPNPRKAVQAAQEASFDILRGVRNGVREYYPMSTEPDPNDLNNEGYNVFTKYFGGEFGLQIFLGDILPFNPEGYTTKLFPIESNDPYLLQFLFIGSLPKPASELQNDIESITGKPSLPKERGYMVQKKSVDFMIDSLCALDASKVIESNMHWYKRIDFEKGPHVYIYDSSPPKQQFAISPNYRIPLDDQLPLIQTIDNYISVSAQESILFD